jgi:glycosyltransferase 2 family protein
MTLPPDASPAPESKPGASRHLVTLLKLLLSFGLLAWLASKGQLDLDRIQQALGNPGLIVLAVALGGFNISTSAIRWLLLLRSEGIECSVRLALRLTWIGHFWNMVIPGAVSGDAVKMYYIGQSAPTKREEAWTTVFADRLIGMAALVSLSTMATLANLEFMSSKPELRNTALTMFAVLVAMCALGVCLGLGIGRGTPVANKLRGTLPAVDVLRRGYHSLLRLGKRPGTVLIAFIISFFSHSSAVVVMTMLGRAATPAGEENLSVVQYFIVVPVALFANALPITPGWIGVGEAVLGKLFSWSGGSVVAGTTVMLLYRGMFYVLSLIGACLYVLHRSDVLPLGQVVAPPGATASEGANGASAGPTSAQSLSGTPGESSTSVPCSP